MTRASGSARVARWASIVALAAPWVAACSAPGPAEPEGQGQVALPVLGTNQINGDGLPAKTVVFTYDDGPDEHTIELAQYLHDQGISVTFFVNGRRLCKSFDAQGNCMVPQDTRACDDGLSQAPVANPKYYAESILDQVQSLGHHIANHSQDHCHLTAESNGADMIFELKTTQDILDRHICDNVFLFRAPYGLWDTTTAASAHDAGVDKLIGPINWDIDGQDWSCWQKGTAVDVCGQGYLDILHARPNLNGIFLMHDRPEFNVGYAGALLMTQWLVPKLQADGYHFGTLDQVTSLPRMPCSSAADAGAESASGSSDTGTSSTSGSTSSSGRGSSGASNSSGSGNGSGSRSATSSASGNGSGSVGSHDTPPSTSSGCGCRISPVADTTPRLASFAALIFGGAALGRRARRPRR